MNLFILKSNHTLVKSHPLKQSEKGKVFQIQCRFAGYSLGHLELKILQGCCFTQSDCYLFRAYIFFTSPQNLYNPHLKLHQAFAHRLLLMPATTVYIVWTEIYHDVSKNTCLLKPASDWLIYIKGHQSPAVSAQGFISCAFCSRCTCLTVKLKVIWANRDCVVTQVGMMG